MGGDGTINEIVNGLAYSTLPLAIIPLGTANVFSLEFNIPSHLQKACELIGKEAANKLIWEKQDLNILAAWQGLI